jgi:hypothetical protein
MCLDKNSVYISMYIEFGRNEGVEKGDAKKKREFSKIYPHGIDTFPSFLAIAFSLSHSTA